MPTQSIKCLGKFWYAYFEGLPLYIVDCLTDPTSTTTSTTVQACSGSCLWTYNTLTHTFDSPCQSCSNGCKCLSPTCPQTLLPGFPLDCYQVRTQCIRTTVNPVIPYCTTTTTSSTTSTTSTTIAGCGNGCLWKYIPGIGITNLTNTCASTCPCPRPTLSEQDYCVEVSTSCQPLPPPPTCSGNCKYVWSGTTWIFQNSTCTAGLAGCTCQAPSIPGNDDDCGIAFETPCNATEVSTTTTFGYSCAGKCVMQWDATDNYWKAIVANCGSTCTCSYPPYDGETDCEYTSTLCVTQTTKRCTGFCTWSYDPDTGIFSSTSTCSTGCKCLAPSQCPPNLEDCYEIRTLCIATNVPPVAPLCKTTTTSTTSTTTTTTLPENCLGGCTWLIVPGVTVEAITNTCPESCPCAEPPTGVATGPCYNVSTGCKIPIGPPPPPGCTGSCTWKYVNEDVGWIRTNYGCIGGTNGCYCDYPSVDADCNDEVITGCHPPDATTTTTSTTPYGCLGYCTLRWDMDSSSWFFVSKNCLPSCTCQAPYYSGTVDCEYGYTSCSDGTSSTSTTTTTTGGINCYYCGRAPYFDTFCSTNVLPSQCTDAIIVSGPYNTYEQCEVVCNTTTTTTSSTTTTTTTTTAYYCITTSGCTPSCDSPCPVSGSKYCVFSTWADLLLGESYCAPGYTFSFSITGGPYTNFLDCDTACSTTSTSTTTTALSYSCYECGETQLTAGLNCYPNGIVAPPECTWFNLSSGPYSNYSDCYDVCAYFFDCDGSDCIGVDAPLGTRNECPPECPTTTTTTTSATSTTTTTTPHYYCITVTDSTGGPCPVIGTIGCLDGNTAGFGGGTISCGGGFTYDFSINGGPFSSTTCESNCPSEGLIYCWECNAGGLTFCGTEADAIAVCGVAAYTQGSGPHASCDGVLC
jgi:hypothetical protein